MFSWVFSSVLGVLVESKIVFYKNITNKGLENGYFGKVFRYTKFGKFIFQGI